MGVASRVARRPRVKDPASADAPALGKFKRCGLFVSTGRPDDLRHGVTRPEHPSVDDAGGRNRGPVAKSKARRKQLELLRYLQWRVATVVGTGHLPKVQLNALASTLGARHARYPHRSSLVGASRGFVLAPHGTAMPERSNQLSITGAAGRAQRNSAARCASPSTTSFPTERVRRRAVTGAVTEVITSRRARCCQQRHLLGRPPGVPVPRGVVDDVLGFDPVGHSAGLAINGVLRDAGYSDWPFRCRPWMARAESCTHRSWTTAHPLSRLLVPRTRRAGDRGQIRDGARRRRSRQRPLSGT